MQERAFSTLSDYAMTKHVNGLPTTVIESEFTNKITDSWWFPLHSLVAMPLMVSKQYS